MTGLKNRMAIFFILLFTSLVQGQGSYEGGLDYYQERFQEATGSLDKQLAFFTVFTRIDFSEELKSKEPNIISNYQEGIAITRSNRKYGFVDKEGRKVCRQTYEAVNLYQEGCAAVSKGGKWTFINKKCEELTSFIYDKVGVFKNGLAVIQKNNKWGVLNREGIEVVFTEYEAIEIDSVGKVSVKNGNKWELFDAIEDPYNEYYKY
jgi:hypothetical protein